VSPHLSLWAFLDSAALLPAVEQRLSPDRYKIHAYSPKGFLKTIEQNKSKIDCLILEVSPDSPSLTNWLHGQAILLPVVLVEAGTRATTSDFLYHTAEVRITAAQLGAIEVHIERAIAQFLNLSPACRLAPAALEDASLDPIAQNFLKLQQRRLAEKLKERLGYLGVYYKRNSQAFLRGLPPDEQQVLLETLQAEYREIVLHYFTDDGMLNQRIDNLVNLAFFADISVSQIVEIHMELMDEFSKQLKLEGRSESVLLDYRLTLIDTIAHLCEMYRRSVPRET
jgi:circadian clock protein KaiA